MVNEFEFVSLREILSRVTRHPMLQDMDLEAAIHYTMDFFGRFGFPQVYEDKIADVPIEKFRGVLPCDLVRIEQVRDKKSKAPLRSMTATFNTRDGRLPAEATFKTSNRIITTSFPEGCLEIAYKAIKVDEDGIPMIPDNTVFLSTLESYIKKERFIVLFDLGKIKQDVLAHAEQDYFFNAGRLSSEFKMPSMSEMQSLTGMLHRMIPSTREFNAGFKGLGDTEHYRRH